MATETSNQLSKLTVRDAVFAATEFLKSLDREVLPQNGGVRLEEVELSEDEQYWLVTLSYQVENFPELVREYKSFKIHTESGKVVAMKIREVNEDFKR